MAIILAAMGTAATIAPLRISVISICPYAMAGNDMENNPVGNSYKLPLTAQETILIANLITHLRFAKYHAAATGVPAPMVPAEAKIVLYSATVTDERHGDGKGEEDGCGLMFRPAIGKTEN